MGQQSAVAKGPDALNKLLVAQLLSGATERAIASAITLERLLDELIDKTILGR